MSRRIDLVNKRFDKLLVLKVSHIKNGSIYWLYRCDCGNEVVVRGSNLRGGLTMSCGCLHIEKITTHGMSKSKIYRKIQQAEQRCNNKNNASYKDYGNRGIRFLWGSIRDAVDDLKESYFDHVNRFGEDDTTLERIDVNGNYCKENCRWATQKEQQNNTRRNHFINVNGEQLTLAQASEKYNINYNTIKLRLRNGRDIFGNVVL